MTHYVYRIFDADNALLYIGATSDVHARIVFHQRPWYGQSKASNEMFGRIDRWTSEAHPSKEAALAAERAAIHAEAPLLNRLHNEGRHVTLPPVEVEDHSEDFALLAAAFCRPPT